MGIADGLNSPSKPAKHRRDRDPHDEAEQRSKNEIEPETR